MLVVQLRDVNTDLSVQDKTPSVFSRRGPAFRAAREETKNDVNKLPRPISSSFTIYFVEQMFLFFPVTPSSLNVLEMYSN